MLKDDDDRGELDTSQTDLEVPLDDPQHRDLLPWQKLVMKINDLLVGDEFEYARDTLLGIQATVRRTKQVTERQERAVENISYNPHGNEQSYRNRKWGGW